MGSSSPLVCHHCWEKEKKNWFEPCPHAMEVFEQGVQKGRVAPSVPLASTELPAVLLKWSSTSMTEHRLVAHAGFGGICGDAAAVPQFIMEKRDGRDGTGAEVWVRLKDESGFVKLLGGAILALRAVGVDPAKAIEAAASTKLKTHEKIIECPRCDVACELAFKTDKAEEPGELDYEVEIGWTCLNCGFVPRCRVCGGSGQLPAKVGDLNVTRVCEECAGYGGGDPAEIEEGPDEQ